MPERVTHGTQPGSPYTYVTTKEFLSHFRFDTLRDLPDMEAFEDAGLLGKEKLLAGVIPLARDDVDDRENDTENDKIGAGAIEDGL